MAEGPNARVLIVDDTIQNIQVLGTLLREEKYQINVAQDGLQALDMVTRVTPDIILLDVMMPELDGFETCRRLKAAAATADIPVIFLTAKVETEDIVKGFELGAVDYVAKPFNAHELLARVRTHLEIQRLRHELQVYNEQLEQMVEDRTAQVRAAHAVLQRQVRELEGRDRLSAAQMSAGTAEEAHEAILQVVAEVLEVPQVCIYCDREGSLRAVAALGLSAPGVIQRRDDVSDLSPSDAVTGTFVDGKPRRHGDGAVVPILYGEEPLGVIEVQGLGDDVQDQEELDTLWRLGREAALVCHTVEMNSNLERGDVDVAALLEISED